MTDAMACAKRNDALDRLMIEAGSLARNWRSSTYRGHAAREARLTYVPSTEQIGEPKFQCAIALRALMRALDIVDADARPRVANAIAETLAALRGERSTAGPGVRKAPADASSRWWVEG